MKVPLSWLREYVDVQLPVEELARILTMAGLEVEDITMIGAEWDPEKILVGEILEVQPHPNADRLTVPRVGYGQGRTVQVVTGAPNIKVGMAGVKVAVALEGARYIDGHDAERKQRTLKAGKLRGVESQGMVMSELELGLSDEHEGIMLLEDDAPVGMPLREYLGDTVLTIAILPNIARVLSIVGVAREVAALTGAPLRIPEIRVAASGPPIDGRARVEIQEPELCHRFALGLIEGVTIGPSPKWMQRRLALAGMRPINNVVDISNYVMLELGEPNHMFDADQVHSQHLVVRLARPGEQLTTLDGKTHTLTPDRLLVCDPTRALSVAGVMGGADSEVYAGTTRVLVEAAIWEPRTIRRTAQALKLPSEASRRFERGVDPELPPQTVTRCLELLRSYAGGTVAEGLIDVYPGRRAPVVIDLAAAEVRRLLGVDLDVAAIAAALAPLGFGCTPQGDGAGASVRVTVPSYRVDVAEPADLCEEVARMIGYERIPSAPLADALPEQQANPSYELEQRVRDVLVGSGLDEVMTHSLISMALVARLDPAAADPARHLRLLNAQAPEHEYMRRSLLPSLIDILGPNLRELGRVALFEIGRIYLPVAGQVLPDEPRRVAMLLAGANRNLNWHVSNPPVHDYFDLKGVVETLVSQLHLEERVGYEPLSGVSWLHPGRAARLMLTMPDGTRREAGVLGELHPQVREQLEAGLPRVALAELDLEALIAQAQRPRYRPISRYPASTQDLAVITEANVPAARVADVIRQAGGELLEALTLFDVYTDSSRIGVGKRSLTYHLVFRALDRTLTDDVVAKQRMRIIRALEQELGATIRA